MRTNERTFFDGIPYEIIASDIGKDEQGREQLKLYTREQAIVVHYMRPTSVWPGDIPREIYRVPSAEALEREANNHGSIPVGPDDYDSFPTVGHADGSVVMIEAPRPLTKAERNGLAALLDTGTGKRSAIQVEEKAGRLILRRDGKVRGRLKADTIPAAVMRTLYKEKAPMLLTDLCAETGASLELRRQTFKRHKSIFDVFIRMESDRTQNPVVKRVSLIR